MPPWVRGSGGLFLVNVASLGLSFLTAIVLARNLRNRALRHLHLRPRLDTGPDPTSAVRLLKPLCCVLCLLTSSKSSGLCCGVY